MPAHDKVVEALTAIFMRAESQHTSVVYQAAVKGIPDGNLNLAVDQAMREVYQPHVLKAWKA